MIVIENLTKRYGKSVAVDGLSFEARDGEITGLLGANGAGKTTTLRIIAGVLSPQAGRVCVTGGPRSLGALLDHTGLYARLTARENIEYFGRLRSLSNLDQRVDEVIEQLGLSAIARQEESTHLADAIRRLPQPYRHVVVLMLEGLEYGEIAEVLGISESNVGVRLNRARPLLRQILGGRR